MLKRYNSKSNEFGFLPKTVRDILFHDFESLIAEDFTELAKADTFPLPLPLGIKLYDQADPERQIDNSDQPEPEPGTSGHIGTFSESNTGTDDLEETAEKLAKLEDLDYLASLSDKENVAETETEHSSDSESESDDDDERMKLRN